MMGNGYQRLLMLNERRGAVKEEEPNRLRGKVARGALGYPVIDVGMG